MKNFFLLDLYFLKAEVLKTLYPVSISVKFRLINKLHIKVKILFAK